MFRTPFRRRIVLIGALALLVAAPVYALVISTPAGWWPVVGPMPAGQYTQPVTISAVTYGDTIVGIETGRDDRSPFCAIVVQFHGAGFALPGWTAPPPVNPFLPTYPSLPTIPAFPPYTPPPPPGRVVRFVYRPVNEPANPGWGPGAAAVGQLESQMQTCMAVAAEFTAFRAASQTNAVPLQVFPGAPIQPAQMYLEFDPNPGPTHLEFYKFHIIR